MGTAHWPASRRPALRGGDRPRAGLPGRPHRQPHRTCQRCLRLNSPWTPTSASPRPPA